MIKCGVCGSDNEAAALFCGTCGSPLGGADAATDATEPVEIVEPIPTEVTPTPDEAVVPGKGGARRDLGIDAGARPKPTPPPPDDPEPITDSATTPEGPTIVCAVCGTVNEASRTYCRRCASELRPPEPPPPPPPPPPVRRTISPMALGLGAAAAVVAVALIGLLVFGGGPGASPSPSAGPSQVAGPSAGPSGPGETVSPTPTQRVFAEGPVSGLIAFARCPADGSDCAIHVRPADVSEKARRIIGASGASALDPAISNDGKRILYVVEPGLRVVTISSRSFVRHSNGPGDSNPFWSPDDLQLTFAGARSRDPGSADSDLEIRLDRLGGGNSVPLTNNDVDDHDPVFTPDGLSIVWVQGEDDQRELKMIDIATGVVRDLTSDAFADEDPAVSPLGGEIVFSSTRAGTGEFDLYLLDLATLQVTALPSMPGDERDPAWSPGGRYIVFSGGEEGAEDLFILDLADNSVTAFTTASGADLSPSWR